MSRADDLQARHALELEIAELEEQLLELKDGHDPEALRECKHRLREVRRAHRAEREAAPPGEGEARPVTANATATTQTGG